MVVVFTAFLLCILVVCIQEKNKQKFKLFINVIVKQPPQPTLHFSMARIFSDFADLENYFGNKHRFQLSG